MDDVKDTIQKLQKKKEQVEAEAREVKFQRDKLQETLTSLEPQILEVFGTTDMPTLEKKLKELNAEAQSIIEEVEALD